MTLLISIFASLLLMGFAGGYFTKVYQHRTYLKKMHELAAEKGGKCLSDKYVDYSTKLRWECGEGHVWEATPQAIKQESWCHECSGSKRITIEEMQEIAAERGGKCLSDKCVNSSTKLRWECSEGHVWEATPDSIKQESWCPGCSGSKHLTIEEMQEIATERGGKCLSDKCVNSSTKLRWECGKRHVWEATPDSIKQGNWCLECSGSRHLTIEEMQEIAADRGGKCLSDEYVNSSTKLRWECRKRHVWEATPNDIKQGSWCLECSGSKHLTIEEMQEIAAERGGKCLSDEYVDSSTKLRWECRKRHVWEATPNDIKQGSWCLECSGSKHLTREGMQEIAAERKGKCLSDKYVNSSTKLRWECGKGHVWEATPQAIKQGNWCHECAKEGA
jgi:hypothetical protein